MSLRVTSKRTLGGALLYFIAMVSLLLMTVVVGIAAMLNAGGELTADLFNALTVGQEALGLFIPTVVFLLIDKRAIGMLRLKNPGWGILLVPIIALVGMFFISGLTNVWFGLLQACGLRAESTGLMLGEGAEGALISLLVIALTPALFEELLFRGVILPSLGWMGRAGAIVVSGILFAMIHGTFSAIPAHLALGLIMGYLAVASGSLFVPVAYHFMHNGLSVGIMYLYDYLAGVSPQFAEMLEGGGAADPYTMIMSGALLMVVTGMLLAALLYIAWLVFRKRRAAFEPIEREYALEQPPNWWAFSPYMPSFICAMIFYVMTFVTMIPVN